MYSLICFGVLTLSHLVNEHAHHHSQAARVCNSAIMDYSGLGVLVNEQNLLHFIYIGLMSFLTIS